MLIKSRNLVGWQNTQRHTPNNKRATQRNFLFVSRTRARARQCVRSPSHSHRSDDPSHSFSFIHTQSFIWKYFRFCYCFHFDFRFHFAFAIVIGALPILTTQTIKHVLESVVCFVLIIHADGMKRLFSAMICRWKTRTTTKNNTNNKPKVNENMSDNKKINQIICDNCDK